MYLNAQSNALYHGEAGKSTEKRLESTPTWECKGRSPLPERERASHVALLAGGPAARLKHYEEMSEKRAFFQL